ncbi:muramoyltetrapeptide carboxypeptidase [Breznakibacter xylanolyticus]|uniref:Muramoyltetrapeptide carboxypeptidase n=1 Tax=Breznakibacter xylanolyticus TaxID=990 RepID=A0A2W7MTE6_9BACT|nr:LD-carboxypeptidase [Breznakibacter xylanolyticus]PZX11238.1 muramoyltetrapeptide carboxypeptidase [Breznakibacter xylanolyticus]
MIVPSFIKKQATFGLVAPAGKVAPEVVQQAVMVLLDAGFGVVKGRYIDGVHHQFSATDAQRLSDLQMMMDAPEVDVILCLRGGYGTMRLVDGLNFSAMAARPKWLVGFSDITVLHAAMQRQGLASLHASMPKGWMDGHAVSDDFLRLMDLLVGEWPLYQVAPHSLNRVGEGRGELCGGNLSLLYALRGTPYAFDPRGKILFIEDLAEYHYHLDRMMQNFRLGGVFDGLSGLVVGHFTEMKDNVTPYGQSVEEIILEAVQGYDFPVMFGFPAGHASPNYPLVMGRDVRLTVNHSEGCLDFSGV